MPLCISEQIISNEVKEKCNHTVACDRKEADVKTFCLFQTKDLQEKSENILQLIALLFLQIVKQWFSLCFISTKLVNTNISPGKGWMNKLNKKGKDKQ